MHKDKFIAKISEGSIQIENITDESIENCIIRIKNVFSVELLIEKYHFSPREKKIFYFSNHHFFEAWKDKSLHLLVYSNNKIVLEKKFNDYSKCFVVISNEKFEPLIEELIKGIDRYSNCDILHYTIGYKSKLNYPYLKNIEFDLSGDINDPQYMQFAKPPVLLDVLKRGYKAGVFIDADVQVRSNVNNLLDHISDIEDGPILHKSFWDYTITHNLYIPGPLVSNFLNLPEKQWAPQGVTNVLIFNQSHKDLFIEWEKICFSEEINDIRKKEFLHDELLLNCIMWKKNIVPKHYFMALNVLSEDDVKFFYNSNIDYNGSFIDMNHYNKGHLFQSHIHFERDGYCVFHCVKDVEIAKNINDIIFKREVLKDFKGDLIDFYSNMKKKDDRISPDVDRPIIVNHYVNGPFVEVRNDEEKNFNVQFFDGKENLIYETEIKNNMWTKINRVYCDDYKVKITENNNLVYESAFNAENKRVYVHLDSSSLGDTIAWFPQVDEFRKKHNCHLICSTFHNYLFEKEYPEIEFVHPGVGINDIYAMYSIGWYYTDGDKIDYNRNPLNFRDQHLQKTASDILGLEFKEIKPKIDFVPKERPIDKKYICIANHSTAQSKYWNNETGWQEVVDYLKSKDYEVILLSKEPDGYMGNINPNGVIKLEDKTLDEIMNYIHHSEGFIGLGSGLSWLAWALNKKVFLISGFSRPNCEMQDCVRIFTPDPLTTCNGCFNDFRLDTGDWNWCPRHKGTSRQFECTKSITGKIVTNKLEEMGI